jgi:hypothetical protein
MYAAALLSRNSEPLQRRRIFGDFLGKRPIHCSAVQLAYLFGEWLSLVEHLVRDQGVGGSNPLSPTNLSLANS